MTAAHPRTAGAGPGPRRAAPPTLRVLHAGPAIGTQGGMAAVIEELCRVESTTLITRAAGTWWPGHPLRSAAGTLLLLIRLPALRRRYDLVHVHLSERGSFLREGLVAAVASLLGFGVAGTFHGADFDAFSRARPRLVRALVGRLDVAFCLGRRTHDAIERIRPGVARLAFNPVGRAAIRTLDPAAAPTVVFAGEIGTRKGFDLLAAAWPAVLEAVPDALLEVAGPTGDLEPASFAGLPSTRFAGPVSRARVGELLRDARVACLPSRREVLPMFVLEALASGTGAVVSDAGEMRQLESCPAVAVLGNPVDPGDLAGAIVGMLRRDPDEQRSAALDWCERHASARSVTASLESGYRDALDRRSGRGEP